MDPTLGELFFISSKNVLIWGVRAGGSGTQGAALMLCAMF